MELDAHWGWRKRRTGWVISAEQAGLHCGGRVEAYLYRAGRGGLRLRDNTALCVVEGHQRFGMGGLGEVAREARPEESGQLAGWAPQSQLPREHRCTRVELLCRCVLGMYCVSSVISYKHRR